MRLDLDLHLALAPLWRISVVPRACRKGEGGGGGGEDASEKTPLLRPGAGEKRVVIVTNAALAGNGFGGGGGVLDHMLPKRWDAFLVCRPTNENK